MFIKQSKVKVIFPNSFFKKKNKIETVFSSRLYPQVAIAAFSDRSQELSIIRLYQLSRKEDGFHPILEIGAFTFEDRSSLTDFLKRLPKMNALELFLQMNSPSWQNHFTASI